MIIIAAKTDGFRRCGMAHSAKPTEYPDGHFTEEQLQILDNEPELIVNRAEEKKGPATIDGLVAAIGKLDPEDASLWTKDKGPTTEALSRAAGSIVNAGQRDEAWAKYQEID